MTILAKDPDDYIQKAPEKWRQPLRALRAEIGASLAAGFEERMSYEMIGYVVPLSIYPKGYLGDSAKPLPFIALAAQKNHIAVYHMGLYVDESLVTWLKAEYRAAFGKDLDIGKSCLRFKKPEEVPVGLIGKLAAKLSIETFVAAYERSRALRVVNR